MRKSKGQRIREAKRLSFLQWRQANPFVYAFDQEKNIWVRTKYKTYKVMEWL